MKINSYDIFDTVITRALIEPRDIFLIVSEHLGGNVPAKLRDNFYSERILAEFKARKASNCEDIGIENIYKELAKKHSFDENVMQKMMDLEIQVELNYSMPISWTLDHIKAARSRGERIIYISDMYLPEEAIKNMLKKHSIFH